MKGKFLLSRHLCHDRCSTSLANFAASPLSFNSEDGAAGRGQRAGSGGSGGGSSGGGGPGSGSAARRQPTASAAIATAPGKRSPGLLRDQRNVSVPATVNEHDLGECRIYASAETGRRDDIFLLI